MTTTSDCVILKNVEAYLKADKGIIPSAIKISNVDATNGNGI